MKDNESLAMFAERCVGNPYIFGTYGDILTERTLAQKAKDYPSHLSDSRVKYARDHYIGKRTTDCHGLIKFFLWADDPNSKPVYNASQDISADEAYNLATIKGKIGTIPERRGICVRYPGHVGVYVGNGIVVEARGFDYGTVKTKLKERKWSDWYEHPFVSYSDHPAPVPAPSSKEDKIMITVETLKKGSKGEQVKTVQRLLKELGFKDKDGNSLVIDGSLGGKSEFALKAFQSSKGLTPDGVCGSQTWTKLIG